jgi:hypothetical protein
LYAHGVNFEEALVALRLLDLVDQLRETRQLIRGTLLSNTICKSLLLCHRLVLRVEYSEMSVSYCILLVHGMRNKVGLSGPHCREFHG